MHLPSGRVRAVFYSKYFIEITLSHPSLLPNVPHPLNVYKIFHYLFAITPFARVGSRYSPIRGVQRWWRESGKARFEPYIAPCYKMVEVGDLTVPLGPPPITSCGDFFAWFQVGCAR